jgi:branched-chain amino acid transport system substrate-binding protein
MSNQKKVSLFLRSSALLALVLLVACSPAATATTAPTSVVSTTAPGVSTTAPVTTTQPTVDNTPIVIGVAAPMTGSAADYGTQVTRGIQIAMDEINAKGGVNGRTLSMKVCDDQCDPQAAAACAQKFVSDPSIFAVLGHICSSCTLAGGPIYNAAGLTAMTVNSSNPTITEQGWQYIFRSTPTDAQQGVSIVDFATKTLAAKKIAIIYSNDDYGLGLKQSATAEITKVGASLVDTETFITGQDKDFSSQLTKIAQAKPDVLFILGQYGEDGLIAKQRVAAGLGTIPIVLPAGAQHQEFITLGGAGAEGAYVAVFYNLAKDSPQNQALIQKVAAKYNGDKPGEQVPWGYDGVYIFAQAIGMGATKATMPQFLHKVDYAGLTGHITFDAKGQVLPMSGDIEVVKNGQFVTYTP